MVTVEDLQRYKSLKVLYHRRGFKICLSEGLKVKVFQDPYLNEITFADPFCKKTYYFQETVILN